MSKGALISGYLVLLFFLHQDFWLRSDASLILGIFPATLAYQIFFTMLAALGWFLVVKYLWPLDLDQGSEDRIAADKRDPKSEDHSL